MSFRPLIYLGLAIALYFLSHSLDLRGDAAPVVDGSVSPERAKYHLAALAALLGALGCFVAAGLALWRGRSR